MYYYSYENLKRISKTEKGKQIIQQAKEIYEKEYADKPILALKYSLYKLYEHNGNRNKFEAMYFERRKRLHLLQLLAVAEEEYFEALEDVLSAICDEFTWVLPAHAQRHPIDLFAAETSFYLAETAYIFDSKLTAGILTRIKKSIEEKIVKVFENNRFNWEKNSSNWSAVCACGVGVSYLYFFPERFNLVKDRIFKDFETYLEAIDEEGYCEEGVGYWQYGFGFFTLFFDVYTQLTGEKPAILSTQKVKNLVQYMQNSQMGEQVYLPFADGGTKFFLGDGQILCAIKTLFGTLFTIDLSAKMKLLEGNYRALAFRLLYGIDKFSSSANEKFEKRAAKTFYYNKAQVFVYKNANYAFAAKGGHNLELHNHNDVGAFQIVKDEKRLLVDIGCGEYTRQYFSDERYSIFVCSSFSHCVPIIGENGQKAGKEYCGEVLEQTDKLFKIDIAKAYGGLIDSLIVSYIMEEQGVRVRYQVKGLTDDITFRFVSDFKPTIEQETKKINIENLLRITNTQNIMPNIQRKEYKGHISPEKSAERVEGNQMINNDEEAWVADYNMMGEDIEIEFYFESING